MLSILKYGQWDCQYAQGPGYVVTDDVTCLTDPLSSEGLRHPGVGVMGVVSCMYVALQVNQES